MGFTREGSSRDSGRAALSRRGFLIGSGALAGLGLVPAGGVLGGAALAHDGGGHAELAMRIWAATRQGRRYLAIGGSGEAPEIRELRVSHQGTVDLGPALTTALPGAFEARALHAVGDRLLVAGGLSEQERTRPVVYELGDTDAREVPLAPAVSVGYGVATGIASAGAHHLAVLIESADDAEQAYNDVTRVAESPDTGRTWTVGAVARDLGEGHPSHVVATGAGLFAVTVDGSGTRRAHQRGPGRDVAWTAEAVAGEGPVLAVVSRDATSVEVVDADSDGVVRRRRRDVGRSGWRDAGTVQTGEPILAVVPVSGSRGELIAIGGSSAHLVGDR